MMQKSIVTFFQWRVVTLSNPGVSAVVICSLIIIVTRVSDRLLWECSVFSLSDDGLVVGLSSPVTRLEIFDISSLNLLLHTPTGIQRQQEYVLQSKLILVYKHYRKCRNDPHPGVFVKKCLGVANCSLQENKVEKPLVANRSVF